MRVLLTRPREDAETAAAALAARGVEVFKEPLLSIAFDDAAPFDLEGAQAIALTSANGARALGRRGGTDLPVFAVGAATAEAAIEAGVHETHSADGDVRALAKLIVEELNPADGAVVHVAGSTVAGDLAGALEAAGFTCRRAVLYAAEPARALSAAATAAVRDDGLDGVLFYSPRTASVFVDLARKARLVRACRNLTAYCLSPAVADAIKELTWREVRIAREPTEEALMQTIRPEAEPGTPAPAPSSVPQAGGAPAPGPQAQAQESPKSEPGPEPGPEPEPEPAAPRRAKMGPFAKTMVYAASVIVLLAVIAAASPLWIDYARQVIPGLGRDADTEARIAKLAGRVAELEAASKSAIIPDLHSLQSERTRLQSELDDTFGRLKTVESQLATVRAMVDALNSDLTPEQAEGALKRLSDRLAALEKQASGTAGRTGESLTKLSEQVAALEKKVPKAPEDAQGRAALLALGQLREAVRTGRGYATELAAFKSVTGDDPDAAPHHAVLESHAAGGVATLDELRAAFEERAGEIVRAGVVTDQGSWIDRTIARLTAPIRWRRTDDLQGDGVEAVVARAEVRLKAGNLEAAVAELAALTGPSAEAAAGWLADARATLAADKALAALQVRAIARLAGNNQ